MMKGRLLAIPALMAASFMAGYFVNGGLNGGGPKDIPRETGAVGPAAPRTVSMAPAGADTSLRNNFLVKAVERASPAVVFIGVTQIQVIRNPFYDDPFFRQFFPPSYQEYRSMGSGVIVTENGIIITNYHVVQNASKINIYLQDGRTFIAEKKGEDPYTDLAFLKINAKGLPAAPMAGSDTLLIGEWAIAIGNPFGALIKDNKPSVTVGVISAVNRDFTSESGIGTRYRKMIQTDAAINPGNSGGALVNALGELIGINTFIFSQNSSGNVGVGFAIPIQRVKKTMKEIIRYGRIRAFDTGISVQNIDPVMAQSLNLKTAYGVIINRVENNSPGKKAGLKAGDVILRVDNYEASDSETITDLFNQYLPGDKVKLTILRDEKEKNVMLLLESRD